MDGWMNRLTGMWIISALGYYAIMNDAAKKSLSASPSVGM
jgi:hypothetical protein